MLIFQNGAFQTETGPYVHRASSNLDQRSFTFTFDKMRDKRNDITNSESFRAKMRNTPTCFPILTILNLVANCVHFHVKWRKACRFDARTVDSFEMGLGKPMLTLNDPNGLKNTTNVYSIHLELRMAFPCQISTGKWKYVNPCLDFLGIPDQRTAYVKWQARPRWTYVRQRSWSDAEPSVVGPSVRQPFIQIE